MTASGIRQMIWRRSEEAGGPRGSTRTRSGTSSRISFLKAGGQQSDLMALKGGRRGDGAAVRGIEQGLTSAGSSQAVRAGRSL
jgi:hypothetical protein